MASEDRRRPKAAPESLRDFVVEKVAEKLDEKVTRHSKAAADAARRAEKLERISAHLGALDVWTRAEPAARKPRFSREEIAATAVRIADAEGFGAISMRRIAAELGAGTMTLYHYVHTKDELLTLVVDAVMGEVVVPPGEPLPADWRAAMTVIADRTRAALSRHPWILDITDDPPIGPNSVRHFDQSLEAVASLPLDVIDKFDIVSAIDEYVFGHCLMERNNLQEDDQLVDAEMTAYVERLLESGEYPQISALAREHGLERTWSQIEAHLRDPRRFRRNLDRLLDGIASSLGLDAGS